MVRQRLKRGQSATGAATLVAVITLVIVLYILFLPPDDRAALLGDDNDSNSNGDNNDDDEKEIYTIESWHIGFLEKEGISQYEHDIAPFNIRIDSNDEPIFKTNAFQVRNGWFDKSYNNISFSIPNFENTDNLFMSIRTPIHKGTLTIILNGEVLTQTEITTASPSPIDLPRDRLMETDNILEFSVSGVGIAFWTTNKYEINDLQIFGEVTDLSNQDSLSSFTVTEREKDNLESVKLKFNPNCLQSGVGKLDIWINSFKVFSQIPDCQLLNTLEISPSYIDEGQNSVKFKTNQGTYSIDQIKVITELKDVIFPVYYFDLNESEYEDIKDGDVNINVTLRFADDEDFKQAKVFINGHIKDVNTYDMEWSRIITSSVERKNNALKIEAKTRMNVREMKIEYVEI